MREVIKNGTEQATGEKCWGEAPDWGQENDYGAETVSSIHQSPGDEKQNNYINWSFWYDIWNVWRVSEEQEGDCSVSGGLNMSKCSKVVMWDYFETAREDCPAETERKIYRRKESGRS